MLWSKVRFSKFHGTIAEGAKSVSPNLRAVAPSPQTPPEFGILASSPSPTLSINRYTTPRGESSPAPSGSPPPTWNTESTLRQDFVSSVMLDNSLECEGLTTLLSETDSFWGGYNVNSDYPTTCSGDLKPNTPSSLREIFEFSLPQTPDWLHSGLQLSVLRWDNLPWSCFQSAIKTSPLIKRVAFGLSPSTGGLEVEDRGQTISVLRSPELFFNRVSSQRLIAIFESVIPKSLDGDITKKVQQFLDPSGTLYIAQLVELFLALISNNVMPREGVERFLDTIMKYKQTNLLRALFSIDTPTIQAVLTQILEVVAINGDQSALDLLLDAGIDRSNLASAKGGRLLQLATERRRTEVAKILLRNGADVNPRLIDDIGSPLDRPPLHHVMSPDNSELVRCLLEAGADVHCRDKYGETALSWAVRYCSTLCIKELLLHESAMTMVDTCQVTIDDLILWYGDAGIDALDYAYLSTHREIYGLLLPYSPQAKACVTTHGVLCAADKGVQNLQTYLGDGIRASAMDQQEILEEALVLALSFPGHYDAIDALLGFHVDPNVPTYWAPNMAVIGAISKGVSAVERLVDAGAIINERKLLEYAASKADYFDVLYFLIRRGASLDLFGVDALVQATQYNLDAVKLLISYGVDPNKPNGDGIFPIQAAAKWKARTIVEYLLRHGADSNAPPCRKLGYTALHYAAMSADLGIVELLVEFGAKITQQGLLGNTVLQAFCGSSGFSGREQPMSPEGGQIFEFLLGAGAEITHPNPGFITRWPVLATLVRKSADYDLIRRVLDAGADVNEAGAEYYTAIQAAAAVGKLELVKEFYSRGADINAPAAFSRGRTALQAACSREEVDMELVTFLLDNGAEINAEAGLERGLTALQGAAIQGHMDLACLLLERGANVNARLAMEHGRTALEGAAEHGRLDMVQFLLNFGGKDTEGGYDEAVELAEDEGHWAVADLIRNHAVS